MSKRTKEQDHWHERGFAAGIAVACAILVGTFGDDVQAEEIMGGAGLTTRAKMKALGCDDYDVDQLEPVFATFRARDERKKMKKKAKAKKQSRKVRGENQNVFGGTLTGS